ncbi:hypothetical protein GC175_04505 [bacterium]|nr:hypothetical protein [bacterium]
MTTPTTVDLPDILAALPESERESLIRAGMNLAIRARIQEIEAELKEAMAQIQRYETQYHCSLRQFEEELLPKLDSLEAHEDYNDWFFWQSVYNEKQALFQSFVRHVG